MGASFVEVSSPGWAFWRALADACTGASTGALYAFLGILIAGIVGEEALWSLYARLDLDPIFRAGMGVFLVVAAVLGVGVPLVFVAERIAALRAVERLPSDAVPPSQLRLKLTTSPFALMKTTGTVIFWCVAGVGAFFALAAAFDEDLRGDVETWIAIGGCAALALVAYALRVTGRRGVDRAHDRGAAMRSGWKRDVPLADRSDRMRREAAPEVLVPRWLTSPSAKLMNRLAMVLLSATLASLGAFMLSVFLRQQCRNCEPVYWSDPVETGIDVLSLASGIAILACATVGAVAWMGGIAVQFVREIALSRWVSDGAPRRIDVSRVAPLLVERRAAVRAGRGLCGTGMIVLIFGWGVLWADAEIVDGRALLGIGGVLLLIGFLVAWTDAPRSRRERQAIRDVLAPGDVARAGARAKRPEGKIHRRRRRS